MIIQTNQAAGRGGGQPEAAGGQPQAGGGGPAQRDGGDRAGLRGHAGTECQAHTTAQREGKIHVFLVLDYLKILVLH